MEHLIWFLGRFHVLVLHLPLGILTLAAALEVLVRFRPFKSLEPALTAVWAAGALSAIVTVLLGFMHASEEAFQDMPAVEAHRWAGVALCVAACLITILRLRPAAFDRLRGASVAAILLLMFATGHLGGNLTHGDTYLVQYAPGPIRVLAGLPADAGPRPRPENLAAADIYLDVVQPALEQRCSNCHNGSKQSGGLSVATYESLMKGGKHGAVITPGKPATSDLFHRVNLTPDAEDFMPRDGKTPLNKNEVAAIGWWIQQGAPKSASVGSLQLTTEAATAIQSIIGLQGAGEQAVAAGAGEAALPSVPEADKAAVAKVVAQGFIVRNVYRGSNLLDVDYTAPKPVTPEIMADLARFAPNIMRLNLRSAAVTDAQVKTIATFRNLRHLRLEKNDLTDAAAHDIASLTELTSLNLTNTRITDQGFDAVARLPRLKSLYVWGSSVTPAAVAKMKSERKDVRLDVGLTASDVPVGGKVIPPDF